MKTFSASIAAFADKTTEAMREVMRQSVQDVVEAAQTPKAQGGRMPVDTGNLRNSLASGLNGAFGEPSGDSYALTIQGMDLGDVAQFAWTAEYARRMELGFVGEDAAGRTYNQSGNHFVGTAAAQWSDIVNRNAAALKP